MPNVFIENATLENIADAIRNKTGKTEKMLPAEMPAEIESIEAGGGGGLKYTSGTVEFASSYRVFYHNLGVIPRIIIIWTNANPDVEENACLGALYTSIMEKPMYVVYEDRNTTAPNFYIGGANVINSITETQAVFNHRAANYPVKQGVTYNWLAIA
ncbi:MAG: hypothetical protein IKV81_03660 [Clostridia bacterium]|nr:hypothetical protein [Clostridia bacterium]